MVVYITHGHHFFKYIYLFIIDKIHFNQTTISIINNLK